MPSWLTGASTILGGLDGFGAGGPSAAQSSADGYAAINGAFNVGGGAGAGVAVAGGGSVVAWIAMGVAAWALLKSA